MRIWTPIVGAAPLLGRPVRRQKELTSVALCALLAGIVIDSLIVEARFTWVAYSVPGVVTTAYHPFACSGTQKEVS